ncbi:NPCBM/NEW2 domain-containing protein [Kribbella antiqua]|nr:NPCBM/NEW2 domain-containing protein [Kribbella antiqua]
MLVGIVAAIISALIGAGATVWAAKQGKLEAIVPIPTVTVVATVPGPTVTTTVTQSPSTTEVGTTTSPVDGAGDSLAEQSPIDGTFTKGSFAIHGRRFGDGLYRWLGSCSQKASATWDLSRRYTQFSAVIGLIDRGQDATLKVKFTAYVTDGTSRTATEPVVLGKYQARELKVPLNHADAIELEAVVVAGKNCTQAGAAAWGDPRLYAS